MVCGKSLHRAKEVKIQLLGCKGSGMFHRKSQAANQGSFELEEEHSWDSELCSPPLLFLPAKELQHVITKSESPLLTSL